MWQPKRKLRIRSLHWRWVALGLVVMIGGHVAVYYAVGEVLQRLAVRNTSLSFVSAGALALAVYFLGGLVVGRMSPGRTIQEPAVAGVLGLLTLFFMQLAVGMINVFGLLIGAPFCFAMAYAGGLVGERWQRRSRRRAVSRKPS